MNLPRLTPKEAEIVNLLVQGYSNAAIGDVLFCSVKNVENHLVNVYAKMGREERCYHPRVKLAVDVLNQRHDELRSALRDFAQKV